MNAFGQLRSLMQQPKLGTTERLELWALMQHAAQQNMSIYVEQWMPYMRQFLRHFEGPVASLRPPTFDIDEINAMAMLLPAPSMVLGLSNNHITDEEVRALAQSSHLANVLWLDLNRNTITAEGARALSQSPHMVNVTCLDLGSNKLADEGARALAQSPNLTALTDLDLKRNQITDEGARALAQSPHLTSLTCLELGNNKLTDEGKRALKQRGW